ncbi:MAG: uroporphyrinogen-III C-methyltransferase [Pseudomonadota bacterium]|nr:uroporphyrinogen-III C-methyltransferase [Pseudomonadota bacterium]
MTEQDPTIEPVEEQPEQLEPPQPTRKSSPFPMIVATAALLVSVGVAVNAYLERDQQIKTAETISQQTGSVEKLLSSQQQNATSLKEQSTKLQTLSDDFTQLSAVVRQDQESWALAEVDYLVRLANYTVHYVGNAAVAKRLLEAADQRLVSIANPQLADIRSSLNDNIIKLGADNDVDIEKLLDRLEKLSANVNDLSILSRAKLTPKQEGAATPQNASNDWKEKLTDSLHSLQSVVVVRHLGEPPKPLITPDQHLNLIENIQLKLSFAQWAVLHRKQQVYVSSLAQAKAWLNEYFRKDDLTLAVINGISELEQAQIAKTLPDLSKLVVAVHESIQAAAQNHHPITPTPLRAPNPVPAQGAPKAKPESEAPAKQEAPNKPEVLSS